MKECRAERSILETPPSYDKRNCTIFSRNFKEQLNNLFRNAVMENIINQKWK